MARCSIQLKIRAPNAHIPTQTIISLYVGVYSTISPNGVGRKPGIISPGPFSIHIPTVARIQAKFSHKKLPYLFEQRFRSIIIAVISIAIADHIHGTRA